MSDTEHTRTPEELEAEIEETREEVGDTVEQLAAKTDVKAQARQRVEEIKSRVRGKTPDGAQQGGAQAIEKVKANPAPFVLIGAVVAAFVIGRRTGRA
jgi:Protein of unknown function (DUF3618)